MSKFPFLSKIHKDDKEIFSLLKKYNCDIKISCGSDYYTAYADEDVAKEIINKLRRKGINLTLSSRIYEIKDRYKRFKKKELKEKLKTKKILILRDSTLEDRITYGFINAPDEIPKLFDLFPQLEIVIDKLEDSWESGVDLWEVYYRNGGRKTVSNLNEIFNKT